MGDVIGLVQDAMQKFDQEETEKLQAKMLKGTLTLDDFMAQMAQVRKLGPLSKVMNMLPGMSSLGRQLDLREGDMENQVNKMQAIYNSMSKKERLKPDLVEHARRRRIAQGAGVQPHEVAQLIKQFDAARDMMRAMSSTGMMAKMGMMKSLMSGGAASLASSGGMLRTKKGGFMEKKDRNKKGRR
jgi:signal recognition particle subunit SRP54